MLRYVSLCLYSTRQTMVEGNKVYKFKYCYNITHSSSTSHTLSLSLPLPLPLSLFLFISLVHCTFVCITYMYIYVGIDEPGKHLLLQCCYAGTLTKYCIVGRESLVVNKFLRLLQLWWNCEIKIYEISFTDNVWHVHKTGTSILKYFETIGYTA